MTEVQETQKRIIDVSKKLFADKGFEGTSIRTIAKEANVNVASVNYHFKTKENLYSQIIQLGCLELSERASSIFEEHIHSNDSVEEFFVKVFKDFIFHENDIVSNMKLLMSTDLDEELILVVNRDNEFGPPGGQVFAKAIQSHFSEKISDLDLHWAVKTIFGHMVHMTIINKCYFKKFKNMKKNSFSKMCDIEEGVRRLVKIILKSLSQDIR